MNVFFFYNLHFYSNSVSVLVDLCHMQVTHITQLVCYTCIIQQYKRWFTMRRYKTKKSQNIHMSESPSIHKYYLSSHRKVFQKSVPFFFMFFILTFLFGDFRFQKLRVQNSAFQNFRARNCSVNSTYVNIIFY